MKRRLTLAVAVLLGLVSLAVVAALLVVGPRNLIGIVRYDQREEGTLKVGDLAPEVSLLELDGKSQVRLSERLGERPTVLILGSFT